MVFYFTESYIQVFIQQVSCARAELGSKNGIRVIWLRSLPLRTFEGPSSRPQGCFCRYDWSSEGSLIGPL